MTRQIAVLLAAVLMLAGCGGSSTPKARAGASAGGWKTLDLARTFHSPAGNIVSVSCAERTFCMILDANAGYSQWQTATYDDGTVSAATSLKAGPGALLSCASPTFCLAYAPNATTQEYDVYNGRAWTSHEVSFGGEPAGTDLTCPAAGRCWAIGNSGASGRATLLEYRDGAFGQESFDSHGQTLTSLSCASADDCELLGNDGGAWHLQHGTWVGPSRLTVTAGSGAAAAVTAVTCTTGPYCIGIGTNGAVVADSGSGFEPLKVTLAGQTGLASFSASCGSPSFCLVQTGASDGYAVLDHSTLTRIAKPPAEPASAFSCASDVCMDDLATSSPKVLVYRPS